MDRLVNIVRVAINIEFIAVIVTWIAFIVAVTVEGVYEELLPLLVVGAHFLSPLTVVEFIVYYEEKWLPRAQPLSMPEVRQWVVATFIALITDTTGLIYGITVSYPNIVDHGNTSLAIALIVFLAALVALTVLLVGVMAYLWFSRMRHRYVHPQSPEPLVTALSQPYRVVRA